MAFRTPGLTFVAALVAAWVLLLPVSVVADDNGDHKRVLLISSYHPSFPTFFQQVDGIRMAFQRAGYGMAELTLDIEFMDSKRFPGPENTARFFDSLVAKLDGQPSYDVVMTSDDNALDFALHHHGTLLQNSPLVFLGVNNVTLAAKQDSSPRVTGVVEAISMGETLAVIESLRPEAQKLFVVTDASRSSVLNMRELHDQKVNLTRMTTQILSLGELTYRELYHKIDGIPAESGILLLGPYRDKTGETQTYLEALRHILEYSKAPVFSLWEHGMGHGVLGGKMISHAAQGRAAAEMAVGILGGATASDMSVMKTSPNVFTFDYTVMEAHGISEGALPVGAVVINGPMPLYERYMGWVPWVFGFLIFQTIAFIVLIMIERRRRRAEKRAARSESRFRSFATTSSDWMWEMDENLRFSFFSEKFAEITGVSTEAFLGKTREEAPIPGVDAALWERHLATLAAHEPFRNFIHTRDLPDGEVVWISINGDPVFGRGGSFQGYRGTGSDISGSMRHKDALQQALLDAEEASRTKSEFLATMSHELLTPLNAILGFSDILTEQYFGPPGAGKYREYAKDIRSSGHHLLALVDDLLDVSAIEAGQTTLEKTNVSIAEVVKECVKAVRESVKTKSLQLKTDIDGDFSNLHADKRAVRQVILNLLSNAVKYTDDGGEISIEINERDESITIMVCDKGQGIPAEKLSTITDPFVRGENSSYVAEPGWGLGLSIANSLVEMHDGSLTIDSTVGVGTCITVMLPLSEN